MKSYKGIIIVLLISCISFQLKAQTLDKQQQSIATIAALTAKGDWDNLKTGLSQGLDNGYMAAFFRQVKIGVLTLTLEKKQ